MRTRWVACLLALVCALAIGPRRSRAEETPREQLVFIVANHYSATKPGTKNHAFLTSCLKGLAGVYWQENTNVSIFFIDPPADQMQPVRCASMQEFAQTVDGARGKGLNPKQESELQGRVFDALAQLMDAYAGEAMRIFYLSDRSIVSFGEGQDAAGALAQKLHAPGVSFTYVGLPEPSKPLEGNEGLGQLGVSQYSQEGPVRSVLFEKKPPERLGVWLRELAGEEMTPLPLSGQAVEEQTLRVPLTVARDNVMGARFILGPFDGEIDGVSVAGQEMEWSLCGDTIVASVGRLPQGGEAIEITFAAGDEPQSAREGYAYLFGGVTGIRFGALPDALYRGEPFSVEIVLEAEGAAGGPWVLTDTAFASGDESRRAATAVTARLTAQQEGDAYTAEINVSEPGEYCLAVSGERAETFQIAPEAVLTFTVLNRGPVPAEVYRNATLGYDNPFTQEITSADSWALSEWFAAKPGDVLAYCFVNEENAPLTTPTQVVTDGYTATIEESTLSVDLQDKVRQPGGIVLRIAAVDQHGDMGQPVQFTLAPYSLRDTLADCALVQVEPYFREMYAGKSAVEVCLAIRNGEALKTQGLMDTLLEAADVRLGLYADYPREDGGKQREALEDVTLSWDAGRELFVGTIETGLRAASFFLQPRAEARLADGSMAPLPVKLRTMAGEANAVSFHVGNEAPVLLVDTPVSEEIQLGGFLSAEPRERGFKHSIPLKSLFTDDLDESLTYHFVLRDAGGSASVWIEEEAGDWEMDLAAQPSLTAKDASVDLVVREPGGYTLLITAEDSANAVSEEVAIEVHVRSLYWESIRTCIGAGVALAALFALALYVRWRRKPVFGPVRIALQMVPAHSTDHIHIPPDGISLAPHLKKPVPLSACMLWFRIPPLKWLPYERAEQLLLVPSKRKNWPVELRLKDAREKGGLKKLRIKGRLLTDGLPYRMQVGERYLLCETDGLDALEITLLRDPERPIATEGETKS